MTGDQNSFHTIYAELLSAFYYHCFNVYVTQTDWIGSAFFFFFTFTQTPQLIKEERQKEG